MCQNNPSVRVSLFQLCLLVVCCFMTQIFPESDIRLWDLLLLKFISILIFFFSLFTVDGWACKRRKGTMSRACQGMEEGPVFNIFQYYFIGKILFFLL